MADLPAYAWAAPLTLCALDAAEAAGTLAYQKRWGLRWDHTVAELDRLVDGRILTVVACLTAFSVSGTLWPERSDHVC